MVGDTPGQAVAAIVAVVVLIVVLVNLSGDDSPTSDTEVPAPE